MSPGRIGSLLGAVALGAVVSVAGVVVHHDAHRVGVVPLPWGLALAYGSAFTAVLAASCLAGAAAAASTAGGWVVCLLLVLRGRPEGDFVLAADGYGQAFTWGGLAIVTVAFVVAVLAQRSPTLPR